MHYFERGKDKEVFKGGKMKIVWIHALDFQISHHVLQDSSMFYLCSSFWLYTAFQLPPSSWGLKPSLPFNPAPQSTLKKLPNIYTKHTCKQFENREYASSYLSLARSILPSTKQLLKEYL